MPIVPSALMLALLSVPPSPSSTLCSGRDPCQIETLEAGHDEKGKPLSVAHLELGWVELKGDPPFNSKFGTGRRAKGQYGPDCQATEWWLLREDKPAQLLLALCDNGQDLYLGHPEVSVKDNLFVYEQSMGGQASWHRTQSMRLAPLVLVEMNETRRSSLESHVDTEETWATAALRGSTQLPPIDCAPDPEDARKVPELKVPRLSFLPRVKVEEDYLQKGWKTVGLGSCALEARNIVLGKLKSPQDAALKGVWAQPDTLLLEVRDDQWTSPSGEKWLKDDHVEVWLGLVPPGEVDTCGAVPPARRPVQWGIRLADGKVFPAEGTPKDTLKVEKVEVHGEKGIEGYRLQVKLPSGFKSASVIYSDSDGGKKQERMLATSPLKFARPETLNPVREVPPEEATCAVRGNQLEVVPTPLDGDETPDIAVLSAF